MVYKTKLSHKKFPKIGGDLEKEAKSVKLKYVRDSEPGIRRLKKGKGFLYQWNGQYYKKDDEATPRFVSLAIPPVWKNVWICAFENGHLQATGIDSLGRKQYRYHSAWNLLRNETKYHRPCEFDQALPVMRKKLRRDMSLPGLPLERCWPLSLF